VRSYRAGVLLSYGLKKEGEKGKLPLWRRADT